MSTSDVRARRMSFDDFKGGIKQRRNSNPGVFAGNIYIRYAFKIHFPELFGKLNGVSLTMRVMSL